MRISPPLYQFRASVDQPARLIPSIRITRTISSGWLPALAITAAVALASPAQAAPFRAIFTGTFDPAQSPYPTGLGPTNTFTWTVVFNQGFSPNATIAGSDYTWTQPGASPQPLFTPQTLTSPQSTGITGTSYNSINTEPVDDDLFTLNNSTKIFTLQTGRTSSGLTLDVGGNSRTIKNLVITGAMPGLNNASDPNLYTFFSQAVPSGQYSCTSPTPDCGGVGSIETPEATYNFTLTGIALEVPGPMGLAGMLPVMAFSRRLRSRINAANSSRVHQRSTILPKR
jgi:hypothetical protein